MIYSSERIKEENNILKTSNASLENEKNILLKQINVNIDFEREKSKYEQKIEQLQNELSVSSAKLVDILKDLDREKSNFVNSQMSIEELNNMVRISSNKDVKSFL